MLITRTHQAMR